MSQSGSNYASRIPRPSGSPKAIPMPNLSNLSLLSESSTGPWERGRMHHNARSPPTQSNMLETKAAEGSPLRPSHPQSKDISPTQRPNHPGRMVMPPGSSHYRQQREGYGFRPASGSSTPSGLYSGSLFSPFLDVTPNGSSSRSMQNGADDERDGRDEMDHLPDVRSMEQLREEVRSELENGLGNGIHVRPGTDGLATQGHGIADEEGLGWPGDSLSFSRCTGVDVAF